MAQSLRQAAISWSSITTTTTKVTRHHRQLHHQQPQLQPRRSSIRAQLAQAQPAVSRIPRAGAERAPNALLEDRPAPRHRSATTTNLKRCTLSRESILSQSPDRPQLPFPPTPPSLVLLLLVLFNSLFFSSNYAIPTQSLLPWLVFCNARGFNCLRILLFLLH